jgi:ABC-type arginine transport system permease subunit
VNVLVDNIGLYGQAFLHTIELFVISAIGSLIGGLFLAAMRVSPVPVLRSFGTIYGLLLLRVRLPEAGHPGPLVLHQGVRRVDRLHLGVHL